MSQLMYNPFNKTIEDVKVEDLACLYHIAEGWYVEYKSTLVSTKSIAKSLAAFANHFGGWLFYGVAGATDGTNVASSFPGLSLSEASLVIENLRNAAKDILNPSPYYEYRMLTGPCADIKLLDDRHIIVVTVPQGINSPYIHGDGKIYRRVADASAPKAETDRFILDQLWERKQLAEEALKGLLERRPSVSKGEEESSLMHVFLLQDPMNNELKRTKLEFDDFAMLMSNVSIPDAGFSINLDNCYTMADGFIGRHIYNNDPYNLVLTWKHYFNGTSIISMPLRKADIHSVIHDNWLRGYNQALPFSQALIRSRYNTGWVVDIHPIIILLSSFMIQHKLLIDRGNVSSDTYAKVSLENIWRTIPFLDTESYVSFIQQYGVPLVQDDDAFAPPRTTFDSLVRIDYAHPDIVNATPSFKQMLYAASLLGRVGNAFGIPGKILFDTNGQWHEALFRSAEITKYNPDALVE